MADAYWSNVVLAMHMDGADGGTVFTEMTGKTITSYGNAKTKTAQYKFGTSSAYFDGSGDYLTASIPALGTGDYTIECWIYPTSVAAGYKNLFYLPGNVDFCMLGDTVMWYEDGIKCVSAAITENSWYHVAAVRSDGVVSVYVNGVPSGTTHSSSKNITNTLAIIAGDVSAEFFTGYIDDLRITNGVARYTADFSASLPTAAFPAGYGLSGTTFTGRTVRAFRRSDSILSDSVTSDGTTGAFSLNAIDGSPHYVISFPATSAENALILDNITPV